MMTFKTLNRAMMTLSFSAFTTFAMADVSPNTGDFQAVCTNAWMQKADQSKNKVDYKNFGEKYCACAATQPLDSPVAIKKAIQICMSQTLLHDAMDALEEEVGLDDAKDTDVNDYCQDRWSLIEPNQDAQVKTIATVYCECAKPKLMEIIKKADNVTDKEYYAQIDAVAAECSGNVPQTSSNTPIVK
jgi:hypothetical protein